MPTTIFDKITGCREPSRLFDLAHAFFRDQGFGGLAYLTPEGPAGPFALRDRGMASEWLQRYRDEALHRFDPIPGLAFRLGQPRQLAELVARLPGLSKDEQCYIEALKHAGVSNVLIVPTYGPFGRPASVALARPAHPGLIDRMDRSLAAAVAQQMHIRMEFLQVQKPPPSLAPREREILRWLGRGKSTGDIATILGVGTPTVATHIQRIYHKLQVHDRASCIARASAHHFI